MNVSVRDAFETLRTAGRGGKQPGRQARIEKLLKLQRQIEARASELYVALHRDFGKPPAEIDLTEIHPTLTEIRHAVKNLKSWMKPVKIKTPWMLTGTRSELRYEPKGVVLIIAPWNYPFSLLINPLVSAIAAGNRVVLKPSELTPATSDFLRRLVNDVFEQSEVVLIEGDATVSKALLELPFDHIFFTGSTRVGKVVMEAAARNLSSVTLELGGKSPAIVDLSADLKTAAARIMWGKFLNAGQTCIAPDYVLVHTQAAPAFLGHCRNALQGFYGETAEEQKNTLDYCRIVNDQHYARLKSALLNSLEDGARVEAGGSWDDSTRFIAPTVVSRVAGKSPLMQEEIFGPILPVIEYETVDGMLDGLSQKEKPLALYIFSHDKPLIERILAETRAGGTCINDTVVHFANPYLPFGGTGPSGSGSYHGSFGFKAFSHERAVLRQSRWSPLSLLYPPYTPVVQKLIRLITKHL